MDRKKCAQVQDVLRWLACSISNLLKIASFINSRVRWPYVKTAPWRYLHRQRQTQSMVSALSNWRRKKQLKYFGNPAKPIISTLFYVELVSIVNIDESMIKKCSWIVVVNNTNKMARPAVTGSLNMLHWGHWLLAGKGMFQHAKLPWLSLSSKDVSSLLL